MTVGSICTRPAHTILPDETIGEAARRMMEHHVGTLIVVDASDRVAGIVTDRDIVLRCVARGYESDTMEVDEIMSEPVETVPDDMTLDRALSRMADREVRRLGVLAADGRLIGVLALDDVLESIVQETEDIGRLVRVQAPV